MTVPNEYETLRGLIAEPRCVIFDVGANFGQTTEVYRVLFDGCTVHAFEPRRAAFEEMRRRLAGAERVHLNHAALGDRVGSATLHLTTHIESASLLPLNDRSWWVQALDIRPDGTETVAIDTVDHYCAERDIAAIDFLKLDVQGFEPECLRGATRMLGERRIGVIQAEIVYHPMYQRATRFIDIEGLLDPFGYRLFTLLNASKGNRNGELLFCDAVFTRV
jgi:FkbM family methyltransferase